MKNIDSLSVLIADDYEINIQVLILSLKRLNISPATANNGKIAVDMFKSNNYDLVLMDLMMPQLDGFEATKQIRKYEMENELSPSIIIAVSANQIDEHNQKLSDWGFNDVVLKPFVLKDLKDVLSKYFIL